jgi:hypothetical protein
MSNPYAAKSALPPAFWAQNFDALGIEIPLQMIYQEVVSRLKEENTDADTLELMLIERIALLYVLIRHKEETNAFENSRAYKELFQLWVTMAADLRKQRQAAESIQILREQILVSVHHAVVTAVKGMPQEIKQEIQERLLSELESAGL